MAFNSALNVDTSILHVDGLGHFGFIVVAVLYISMGVGGIISSGVINKLGTRACLVLGGFGCIT